MRRIVSGIVKSFPAKSYCGLTRSVIIAAISILAISSSRAADALPTGIFIRAGGGLSEAMNAHVKDNDPDTQILDGNQAGSVPGSLNKVIGSPFASVGIGYGITSSLRVGFDFSYHTGFNLHDHDQHFATGTGGTPTDFGSVTAWDGQIHALSYTGKVAYYFPAFGAAHPYVSGGAGLATVTTDTAQLHYNGVATSFAGQSSSNLAYNFGAGIAVSVGKHATLDVGYQYSNFGDIKYPKQTFNGNFGPQPSDGLTGQLKSNDFIASLTFFFR